MFSTDQELESVVRDPSAEQSERIDAQRQLWARQAERESQQRQAAAVRERMEGAIHA